ncbi:MAG: hypothetical protein EA398_16320, partial [Deltaproteobacteria bacterium]
MARQHGTPHLRGPAGSVSPLDRARFAARSEHGESPTLPSPTEASTVYCSARVRPLPLLVPLLLGCLLVACGSDGDGTTPSSSLPSAPSSDPSQVDPTDPSQVDPTDPSQVDPTDPSQ